MRQRVKLHIRGVVQGVGFRPHVFRLSRKFSLGGCVFNDSKGVTVEIEGESNRIKDFIEALKITAPAISSINKIRKEQIPLAGESNFIIIKSRRDANKTASFPVDIAICEDCHKELFDKANRRYLYPFINCTNCGPRFTIIEDIPYDRKNSTMKHFEMCPSCAGEYTEPADRRFHAEPNACFSCGPQVNLLNNPGGTKKTKKSHLDTQKVLEKTTELITKGNIVAIKGIGGYHLACDARNVSVVRRLRHLKNRPTKPFAIMVEELNALSEICNITASEKKLIESIARPITLLEIKKNTSWIAEVCPGQNFLGAMLCYAPLHYLLFHYLKKFQRFPVLVMTSANRGDFPLVACETELFQIEKYADYFLVHNRIIQVKCDDSIARVFQNKEIIIRKARGYTPDFINFTHKKNILACGAELKNTFSLAAKGHIVSSPYLGDLKNYENYELYLKTLSHYKKILDFKPEVVAHDLHPDYLSTQYALSLKSARKIAVQHHHAHLAGCLFENNVEKKAIGVCFDGAGLGIDGNIWGGEFFVTDKRSFKRAGCFKYFGLLGADKAQAEPARIAFHMLYDIYGENMFKLNLGCVNHFKEIEKNIFCKLIENKETVMTSSAGRLFDAVASILNIKHTISYEAEAAVSLEMAAGRSKLSEDCFDFSINKEQGVYPVRKYPVACHKGLSNSTNTGSNAPCEFSNGIYIINWQDIFSGIIKDLKARKNKESIAYKFHFTCAKIIKEMSVILRNDYGINDVAISGGVFQNFLLLRLTLELLKNEGFSVYYHKRIPTNDSGVSIGQAVIANAQI